MARIAHVEGVAFSPNRRLLATRNNDDTAGLMWADPQRLFGLLCIKVGINLSIGEWRTHIGADEPWRSTCPNWGNAEVTAQDR